MVKIVVKNHKEIKLSPFAFGSLFSSLDMLDNPTEDDLQDATPRNGTMITDYEYKQYTVENKYINEDNNVVVELEQDED